MAEPVLRDPAPPEPVRRRGPQAVRAATPKASPSTECGSKMPVEEVPMNQVPAESVPAGAPGTLSPEIGAVSIDSLREMPPASSATAAEPPRFSSGPAATTHSQGTARSSRTRPANIGPPKGRTPSQEMLDELRSRLEQLRQRVEEQTVATGIGLKRELAQDADYVKIRARYYHERRPLQALGMVAAGGFVFGLFLGLWRR